MIFLTEFLVAVTCAAHLASCPIPQGYRTHVQVNNKDQCEERASSVIAAFGYRRKDFNVRCEK